jgi:hypothetical protein
MQSKRKIKVKISVSRRALHFNPFISIVCSIFIVHYLINFVHLNIHTWTFKSINCVKLSVNFFMIAENFWKIEWYKFKIKNSSTHFQGLKIFCSIHFQFLTCLKIFKLTFFADLGGGTICSCYHLRSDLNKKGFFSLAVWQVLFIKNIIFTWNEIIILTKGRMRAL